MRLRREPHNGAELLSAYVADDVGFWQRRGIRRHLEKCPACAAYVDQLRHVVALTARLGEDGVPAELRARLDSAFTAWRAEHPA